MKNLLLLLIILWCCILCNGQINIKTYYWGDESLDKGYGYSPYPPYNEDTTIVVSYILPYAFNHMEGVNLVFLYKSDKDSIPQELMTYVNGERSGIRVGFGNKGINFVQEQPAGPTYHFLDNKIVSAGSGSTCYHKFIVSLDITAMKITVSIANIEYDFRIDYKFTYIKIDYVVDHERYSKILWSRK